MQKKHLFRTAFLLFIASMFFFDIYRRISDVSNLAENYHQKAINMAFRSAFGVFELVVIGIMIFFISRYPRRRIRLLSLLSFHIVGVLAVPMATRDVSWMALSFPWPQTLLAFDKATPVTVLVSSLAVGFVVIPVITLLWAGRHTAATYAPWAVFTRRVSEDSSHPLPAG